MKKDNLSQINNIIYYNIDEKGYIEKCQIKNESGIYIYINLETNECYIGLSINISRRLSNHKYNVNNHKKGCPKFYKSVYKYGWNNFKVGILEHIDSPNFYTKDSMRELLKTKEDYYIFIISPSLNIRKIIKKN